MRQFTQGAKTEAKPPETTPVMADATMFQSGIDTLFPARCPESHVRVQPPSQQSAPRTAHPPIGSGTAHVLNEAVHDLGNDRIRHLEEVKHLKQGRHYLVHEGNEVS